MGRVRGEGTAARGRRRRDLEPCPRGTRPPAAGGGVAASPRAARGPDRGRPPGAPAPRAASPSPSQRLAPSLAHQASSGTPQKMRRRGGLACPSAATRQRKGCAPAGPPPHHSVAHLRDLAGGHRVGDGRGLRRKVAGIVHRRGHRPAGRGRLGGRQCLHHGAAARDLARQALQARCQGPAIRHPHSCQSKSVNR